MRSPSLSGPGSFLLLRATISQHRPCAGSCKPPHAICWGCYYPTLQTQLTEAQEGLSNLLKATQKTNTQQRRSANQTKATGPTTRPWCQTSVALSLSPQGEPEPPGLATISGSALGPTLVGAVGMCLVAVVPTVIISVTGPVLRDAAPTVAFELGAGAGVAAAGLVAVVPTVVVWSGCRGWGREKGESSAG